MITSGRLRNLTPSVLLVSLVLLAGCAKPVPDVVNMAQAAASVVIIGADLTLGPVIEQCTNTVGAGLVISQIPSAGQRVQRGNAVALVVSTGFCLGTVPNVTGQTESAAGTLLTSASLGTGAVTQQCSDTVGAGLVISQTPAAGQQAQPGSTVALVVSTGPCPETTMLPGDVPLVLVWVPGGTFQMGCYSGEQDSSSSEDPQHTVTLGGFYMVKYELTKRQWTAVMGTTPWAGQPNVLANQDSPAVCLSWGDAQSFLASLNIYTGKAFRLPSESEWEYACRGGTTSRFHWGDDPSHTTIGNYAWYGGNCSSEQHAHLVGQKLRNAFGLYDMSGNAWEWCEDDWHNDYTNAPQAGQAWVDSPRGFYRVVRGGSWGSNPISCRSAYRNFITPDDRGSNIGFRVVRTP